MSNPLKDLGLEDLQAITQAIKYCFSIKKSKKSKKR